MTRLTTLIFLATTIAFFGPGFSSGQQLPSTCSPKRSPPLQTAMPDSGSIADGAYRNIFFQFSYRIPFGWVDRTSEMAPESDTKRSKVLLAVFERPPTVTGTTVNAAVVITAESTAAYPGLKTAADYFGPLSQSTKSKGFTIINNPYEFPVDGKEVVREDFSNDMGSVIMHQSSLAWLSRGWIVSFTFIAGSDDDVTELIENLKLAGRNKH